MKTIFIVAAGSGGHVFPALSLANELTLRDCKVVFITKEGRLEDKMLRQTGIDYLKLPVERLKFSFRLFTASLKLFQAFWRMLLLIKKNRPSALVGFGGYISAPVILAAYLNRTPALIHEQNVELGKANKLLALFAKKIAVSFEKTKKENLIHHNKMVFTGNPVRKKYFDGSKEEALKHFALKGDKFTVLIFGGSQGSLSIDNFAQETLKGLPKNLLNLLQILHICGKNNRFVLENFYRDLKIDFRVFEFLDEICQAYRASDLVISRAGATTIAELTTYGIASVLIPYPFAGKHQFKNAQVLEAAGAGFVVEENSKTVVRLRDIIIRLAENKGLLETMSLKAKTIGFKDAAQNLSQEVLALC